MEWNPLSGIVLAADGPVVCGVWPRVLRALGKEVVHGEVVQVGEREPVV
jgi:hypothetical protein